MMKRRDFITLLGGAAAAWPQAVFAQSNRMPRIGVLVGLAENDPEAESRFTKFRQELARLGWSEGRNVHIDYLFAPAGAQVQERAQDLIALRPDVILAHSTPVAVALHHETRVIPIVFVNVSDPIGAGLVASLARPGGNITGMLQYEAGIFGKWLGMLKEFAPRISRVALLANPELPGYHYLVRSTKGAAPSLSIELVPIPVANAAEIERSMELFARVPNGGLILPPESTTILHRSSLRLRPSTACRPSTHSDSSS
jgi:putative tryptophan/tyrosine transport system substrate-binding protein